MFTHDQFRKIPDSALKDVAPEAATGPEVAQNSPNAQQPDSMADELYNAGKHTENTAPGSSATPGTGGSAEAPKSAKKNLSQLTGGKGGKFAMNMMNYIVPALLCFLIGRFGYKLDKKVFDLTKEEREFMEPVLNDLLDSIYIDFNNPWMQFALVFGMVYGVKLMDAIPDAKKIIRGEKIAEVVRNESQEDIQQRIKDEFNEALLKRIDEVKKEKRKSADWAKKHLQETGEMQMMREKIERKYQKKQAA